MPLLSQAAKKKPRPSAKKAARAVAPKVAPLFAIVGANVEARIAEVSVTALPEGALWIAEAKTLIVSDLHLEKGSSFARNGQLLPPYDTHATLARVAALMDALAPDIVVSLGDSFHDRGGPARMHEKDRALLQTLIGRCDWIWVEGNHDGKSAETIGGIARDVLKIGALTLRHEPSDDAQGEIAGHLHPCARVVGRGRSVRRRCFATDGRRLIMPSFGAFTGGLNIFDEAFAPIFPDGAHALMLGRARVVPANQARLIGD
ncbi:MAG TPA: ligase-associated DNA damage response endonuclease PdeM [Vitreimonas sp.]|jgi:DNA ligase-associated metallophosphoesterase|nr:ligase-associated DNA damage response endonuclease PdeM [Vitreimonas sp.]